MQQVDPLVQLEGVLNLLPFMQVGRLLSVIENATCLLLPNDSAALHIAIGFNKPCVALYGPTNPAVVQVHINEWIVWLLRLFNMHMCITEMLLLGTALCKKFHLTSVLEKIEQLITELQS